MSSHSHHSPPPDQLQSTHWIDDLVQKIGQWQQQKKLPALHVDDMKTPSGRVHTGSLRGVVLHDAVAKALKTSLGQEIEFTYVFNSMDSMDGLPSYLDQSEYQKQMGKPLFQIPAPPLAHSGIDFSQASNQDKQRYEQAANFAQFYALDFMDAWTNLGAQPQVVWSHELYESGQMDKFIKLALDGVKELKKIYRQVAEYDLPADWYPFQVICPKCGKLGTTLVTAWDGQDVTYECRPKQVEWALGCGHQGKTSPFGGKGKLLWKVDWPAHWAALGINVEGAGKDHTSAGGSRDMARSICEQVFHITEPFDIPYEWILIRGAKMSSSKGVGTSAREFVKLFPPQVGRFLFVNKKFSQVIDFDPTTMSVPDLFDEYDLGARIYWGQEQGDQRLGRSFELAQIGAIPQAYFLPRFRDLAVWHQHPEIELSAKFAEVKGSPLTRVELKELATRVKCAVFWIEKYAPPEFDLRPQAKLPSQAKSLSEEQKQFLRQVDELIDSQANWEPSGLQQQLFELAKNSLGTKPGFQAIYLAFLGKTHGPRAGWFLLAIKPELRKTRIQELQT